MRYDKRPLLERQLGVTLIEIMLVLVIGSIMLYIGISQYYTYRAQQDVVQLKSNVDALFNSLGQYYQANCRNVAIFPVAPALNEIIVVSMNTLRTQGFLTENLPANPIVDATVGYIMQFNATTSTRNVNFYDPSASLSAGPTPIIKTNSVYIWRAQVAIKLANTTRSTFYRNLLAADCASGAITTSVTSCVLNPTDEGYLVWEKLPSFGSPGLTSGLWASTPNLRQFNQQYTNDDYYAYSVNDTVYNGLTHYEDYYCGG